MTHPTESRLDPLARDSERGIEVLDSMLVLLQTKLERLRLALLGSPLPPATTAHLATAMTETETLVAEASTRLADIRARLATLTAEQSPC